MSLDNPRTSSYRIKNGIGTSLKHFETNNVSIETSLIIRIRC
jgi:hypothetical protein